MFIPMLPVIKHTSKYNIKKIFFKILEKGKAKTVMHRCPDTIAKKAKDRSYKKLLVEDDKESQTVDAGGSDDPAIKHLLVRVVKRGNKLKKMTEISVKIVDESCSSDDNAE